MKIIIAVLASVLFLAACEMQQDPIAGAPDTVKNGQPPEANKPLPEKPMDKEGLVIDVPQLVNGRAGVPVEFKVLGRVMDPSTAFEMSVDNLADFAGATFDPATGEFKWVPTRAQLGGQPSATFTLRVSLTTIPTAKSPVISVEKKEVLFVISNYYSKPIINTVTGESTVVSGKTYKFEMTLEDVDAYVPADVTLTTVDCSNSYTKTVSHLARVNNIKADAANPGKYIVAVDLDLQNTDNLESGSYCFAYAAISKHGVSSDIYKRSLTIDAKVRNTKITLDSIVQVIVGNTVPVSFSIFDPSGNGELTMTYKDDIAAVLPGSTLECKSSFSRSPQIDCQGMVYTTNAAHKIYEIKMVVETLNRRSNQKTTSNHSLRINVKAANP